MASSDKTRQRKKQRIAINKEQRVEDTPEECDPAQYFENMRLRWEDQKRKEKTH